MHLTLLVFYDDWMPAAPEIWHMEVVSKKRFHAENTQMESAKLLHFRGPSM